MLNPVSFTIPIEPDLKNRLDKLSNNINRSAPSIAALAIQEFVDTYEWQSNEILAAVQEADNGDFASENEVAAVFNKWREHENLLVTQSIT